MDLLHDILANEVFPAVGCTEPISCAYAAAAAVEQLGGPAERLELTVDPGTYKNGAAVTIPNSGGRKGNLTAAAMGAVQALSAARLEILKDVTPELLTRALELVEQERIAYRCDEQGKKFKVEVTATRGTTRVRVVVSEGHTNITCLERDGVSILHTHPHAGASEPAYRAAMQAMRLAEVLEAVCRPDAETRAYLRRGAEMNMAIAEKGLVMQRTAYQMQQMMRSGLMADDLFYQVKLRVASAVDARMGGMAEPVMTSGGSGNQGALTILVPHLVGTRQGVAPERIEESLAVSHAVNSYIKCFTGELSVICGCAIAASVAAAIALVYQQAGISLAPITRAMGNVLGDLCGIICDGAKPGCSMKIVSGADTAMRSAFMALGGYGLSSEDGMLGRSAEESIRNLSRISFEGMGLVDATVVHILQGKTSRSGRA